MADTQQQQAAPVVETKKGNPGINTKTSDLKKKASQVQKPVGKKAEDVSKEVEPVEKDGENVGESLEGAPSKGKAAQEDAVENTEEQIENTDLPEVPELKGPFGVQDNGEITNASGIVIGKLVEGELQDLVGQSIKRIGDDGQLETDTSTVIGRAELKPEILEKIEADSPRSRPQADTRTPSERTLTNGRTTREGSEVGDDEAALSVAAASEAVSAKDEVKDEVPNGEDAAAEIKDQVPESEKISEDVKDQVPEDEQASEDLTKVEPKPDTEETLEPVDLSILKGKIVNKLGKVTDADGTPFGQIIDGDPKKLAGKKVDAEGKIWDDSGKVIGQAELLPESERVAESSAPFEDFPGAKVESSGNVVYEGRVVGRVIEGDAKKLSGKEVDADGDILDKVGNSLGKAERYEDEEEVPEPEAEPEAVDLSLLEGKKVNKARNVVDDRGKLFGRVVDGEVSKLVGRKVDANGKIWSDSGKVIGSAELLSEDDRDQSADGPFVDFPDSLVEKNGTVTFEGKVVGRLIEGEAKKLAGKKVDKDGEIVDSVGNVLGKAERWEEEEVAEPEPEIVDLSILAGKRVNKLGNVVDGSGSIFGRIIEGDAKKLASKMVDKNGDIWDDGGSVVGKAELVPDSERSGNKEGIFSGFDGLKVNKDGKIVDSKDVIVGRLTEGDAQKLYGKAVDEDGDVLDSNGNTLGKAERWQEEEKKVSRHPAADRKVNKKGEVVDENGDVIAKLTEGELTKCAGKEIDADGDVVDGKGSSVGHVTLLEDIPEPEPEVEPVEEPVEEEPKEEEPQETEEQIAERKQLEQDKKLAKQMTNCISQSLDKIKPILGMITDAINTAEAKPKDELDEQKLVDTVKPLIEQGSGILNEANGVIRGLDPDGRLQANAKGKTSGRDATSEEHQLAEVLKELSGSVTQTIEQAKKKIAGMPHAKKELNPLWGLLAEPLGQILAAVGLLLSGVLGLVGKLLSVLGLGGLLDNLLGGLGIKGILKGLGLGSLTDSLTGKK